MTRFEHVLHRAESTLRAPEPQRSRVLLELAHDLDDLFGELRAGGLTEDEAARRAESLLAPSPEALAALCRIHAPWHVRLAERYAGSPHRLERWLLNAATVLSLFSAVYVLISTSAFAAASPALWVLLVLLARAAWHGAAVLLQVPDTAQSRGGRDATASHMTALLWLAGLACAIGLAGAAVEVWRMSAAAQAGATGTVELAGYVGRGAEVLTFAFGLVLATSLVWFAGYRRTRGAAVVLRELQQEEGYDA